jgi:very-short-patch-repair endonuclease
MQIFNRREDISKRRQLRRDETASEKLLWAKVRNNGIADAKFRRQYSVGAYVLDFYCPEVRLAIEIDGSIHDSNQAQENDAVRQCEIESLGIRFLRFSDARVYGEIDSVTLEIQREVERLRELKRKSETESKV